MDNNKNTSGGSGKEKIKTAVSIALFVFFVACFITGYGRGEAKTVLSKAVNICLECIGIG